MICMGRPMHISSGPLPRPRRRRRFKKTGIAEPAGNLLAGAFRFIARHDHALAGNRLRFRQGLRAARAFDAEARQIGKRVLDCGGDLLLDLRDEGFRRSLQARQAARRSGRDAWGPCREAPLLRALPGSPSGAGSSFSRRGTWHVFILDKLQGAGRKTIIDGVENDRGCRRT